MPTRECVLSRPGDDGFYMPAEWCRHARTWMAWPLETTEDDALKQTVIEIARTVRTFEPLSIVALPGQRNDIRALCGRDVEVVEIPHRSARLRDTGPTFLVDGKGGSAAVDWHFDGWGGRADEFARDAKLSHTLLGAAEVRRFRAPISLAGSSFIGDGQGTVVASATALLDPARNPELGKLEGYEILNKWLGATRVIWLAGLDPDDPTQSDLRSLCAFVAPGEIIVPAADPGSPKAPLFDAVTARLESAEDALGRTLHVTRVPHVEMGSYTNFYVCNTGVLIPAFGGENDRRAQAVLGSFFTGREGRLIRTEPLAHHGLTIASLLQFHPARLLERDKATLLPKSAWQRPAPDYVGLLDEYIEKATTRLDNPEN